MKTNFKAHRIPIGYSKEGTKRKCEEQNDFHWGAREEAGSVVRCVSASPSASPLIQPVEVVWFFTFPV